jgi:BlaI family transcriptional regulator, penicillinase repressor
MAELNRNELEALRILWEGEALKPGDIQQRFSWPIENATLRSVLNGLVEKGQLARSKQGKAFFYRAKTSQRGVMARMADLMAHVFSGGSPAGLIAQLIQTQKLSPEEIAELRRLAEEKEEATQSATPRTGAGPGTKTRKDRRP